MITTFLLSLDVTAAEEDTFEAFAATPNLDLWGKLGGLMLNICFIIHWEGKLKTGVPAMTQLKNT